ncbi:uncharacterized protein LOC130638725 [Hydractinia symbiolongicarpus]|uniref:uncharacterized protein LOC130638725 n=1 Tax=Hydractinia symbiolongicarpus TaxID=13093 RepID=UPI00254EEB07|nr:uncharacterized protein LOC130638725 [Hydractinia symbiolongicarpus]
MCYETFKSSITELRNDQQIQYPFLLITGKPGTGKSEVLKHMIEHAVKEDCETLVVCPTGYLTCSYQAIFGPSIKCDTVHSSFYIPVNKEYNATMNWNLCYYHVIIIDEVIFLKHCHYYVNITKCTSLSQSIYILGKSNPSCVRKPYRSKHLVFAETPSRRFLR